MASIGEIFKNAIGIEFDFSDDKVTKKKKLAYQQYSETDSLTLVSLGKILSQEKVMDAYSLSLTSALAAPVTGHLFSGRWWASPAFLAAPVLASIAMGTALYQDDLGWKKSLFHSLKTGGNFGATALVMMALNTMLSSAAIPLALASGLIGGLVQGGLDYWESGSFQSAFVTGLSSGITLCSSVFAGALTKNVVVQTMFGCGFDLACSESEFRLRVNNDLLRDDEDYCTFMAQNLGTGLLGGCGEGALLKMKSTESLRARALRGRECTDLKQVGALQSLLNGKYGPEHSAALQTLLGDHSLGLGTFPNFQGGEMMVHGGQVFSAQHPNGVTRVSKPSTQTPFAMTTEFRPLYWKAVPRMSSYNEFQTWIQGILADFPHDHVAVHLAGRFDELTLQCVQNINKPDIPFSEIDQSRQLFTNVKAKLMGFRVGQVDPGINREGLHLHALVNDMQGGGHVLNFKLHSGWVSLQRLNRLIVLQNEDRRVV